jgi:hypothetical protein
MRAASTRIPIQSSFMVYESKNNGASIQPITNAANNEFGSRHLGSSGCSGGATVRINAEATKNPSVNPGHIRAARRLVSDFEAVSRNYYPLRAQLHSIRQSNSAAQRTSAQIAPVRIPGCIRQNHTQRQLRTTRVNMLTLFRKASGRHQGSYGGAVPVT